MVETFSFIARYEGEIPGATPRDCGNWSYTNLPEARRIADRFLLTLSSPTAENLNYPD